MISPEEVCASLKASGIFSELTEEDILPFCRRAVRWVSGKLKEDAVSDTDLLERTVESAARYFTFTGIIGLKEAYGSFKVGDMTLKRDIDKEYRIEKELFENALCDAAKILKDGGFYFAAG